MKTAIVIIGAAAIMISGGYIAAAEQGAQKEQPANAPKTEVKAQTLCPVMGGAIDKKQFADHDGKRVYFCCPGCAVPFKKDPAKYIKKIEDGGVTLEKTPVEKDKKGNKATGSASSSEKKGGCGGCGK